MSIVKVYSCLSDAILLSRNTTIPPPSTVSIVRARRFGVNASKSLGGGGGEGWGWGEGAFGEKVDRDRKGLVSCSHLKHTHAVGASEYLVCLRVITVANGRCGYEQFKRVVLCVERSALQFLLQLAHALLTVTRRRLKAIVLAVATKLPRGCELTY